jgi:hypothetical protein
MNWAVLMVGGVALLATLYYIVWGRKQYSPPNDTVEDYIMRAEAGPSEVEEKEASGRVEEIRVPDKILEEAERQD